MALSKITYTDKETLNPLPSVADKNKVSDDDMNEIKQVVNGAIDQLEIQQQTTAPSTPVQDQLWIDTTNNQLKRYNGSSWENVGAGAITVHDSYSQSTTEPYSCNYINDKLGWTLIGTTTGNGEISLPSGWKELYACISLGGNTSIYNTIITNSLFVGTTNKQLRFGYYLTYASNSGGSIYITTSGTKAQTLESFADNSDVLANTTTYWYYK